jgi:hypothetical protein
MAIQRAIHWALLMVVEIQRAIHWAVKMVV